ncbi:MAG: HTH-type transcriptional activator RhaR [Verrucomicrobiae bacterium]|nr:HTH-type transcriptional activator RhaR [Verrucomicrobiae bacterium]
MNHGEHLVLQEHRLPPTGEWTSSNGWWRFVRVHDGSGLLVQPATLHLLNPNDVLICPPACRCQIRASQLGELRLHSFQVNLAMLSGVLTVLERQQLEAASQKSPPPRRFDSTTVMAQQFANLSQPEVHPLHRRCQMLQLAAPILSEHLPTTAKPERILPAKARFEQLFQKISEAELQYRKPEDLARLCGCSVRHFSRLFREHFGHSLTPKKTELRIQKAQQLLVESDAKIIDVALDCGFQHVSQFTAIFRRLTKLTPSQYRRRKHRAV